MAIQGYLYHIKEKIETLGPVDRSYTPQAPPDIPITQTPLSPYVDVE
jgi:hypothetical protein